MQILTLSRTTVALALSLAVAPAISFAQDKAVATVNGQAISEADIKSAESAMGPELARLPQAQRRQRVVQILVETEVLATAAEADKLDKEADFDARMKTYRRRALRDAYFEKKIRDGISEADIKAFYDKQAQLLKDTPQVRASHILVEKEDDAKSLRARIVKGEDFAKLAKEHSKDPGSGAKGGDLGFLQRHQTVGAFDEMVFKLKPGEMSEPVKTEFGYHIIRVDEIRALPPIAELKDRIVMHLVQEKAQATIQDLRSKAKIEFIDPELKKAGEAVTIQSMPAAAQPAKK